MAGPRSRNASVAFAALLVIFAGRLIHTASEKSFTVDEPHYIAKGLYLWNTGDYHWYHTLLLHPPLAYHLASVPLLVVDVGDVGDLARERMAGWKVIRSADTPLHRLRLASRLPFVLISCWGAALTFLWARELAGLGAGLLAAFLFTCSPTTAAYGPLVHSDMLATVCVLQTLYTFWRWWKTPSLVRMGVCGLSLGLALSAKMNAVLLLPMLTMMLAVLGWRAADAAAVVPATGTARVWWGLRSLAGFGGVALAVLWCAYGGSFRIHREPSGPLPNVLLPDYVHALLVDRLINDQADRVFWFFGKLTEPAWYMLPVVFALKTPLAILCLGVGGALRHRSTSLRTLRLSVFLGIPALTYVAVACFLLHVPAGVRFLLPLYPMLFIFIAARLHDLQALWQRVTVGVCCAALALAGLAIHPHYLAYFNVLGGGPRRGHEYLADSNLDWGQDVGTLARWLRERGNPPLHTALFSAQEPRAYGIRAVPLQGCEPLQDGLVAISVSVLRGLYHPQNYLGRPSPGCYDWLLAHEPIAAPGYSILVYDVRPP